MTSRSAALAGVAVVVLAIIISVPLAFQAWNNATGSSTTSTVTTTTINTTSTTITTISSISTTQTNMSAVSFTYSPTYPIRVQSVRAVVSTESNGDHHVIFEVSFENAGNTSIYVVGGCGSDLSSTIPSDSSVLQKVPGGPLCACPMFIQSIDHGQNHMLTDPGCWSGYAVKLLHSGSAMVNFTLPWSIDNSYSLQNENSTTINAEFTFS
jgi:hypothetical protein